MCKLTDFKTQCFVLWKKTTVFCKGATPSWAGKAKIHSHVLSSLNHWDNIKLMLANLPLQECLLLNDIQNHWYSWCTAVQIQMITLQFHSLQCFNDPNLSKKTSGHQNSDWNKAGTQGFLRHSLMLRINNMCPGNNYHVQKKEMAFGTPICVPRSNSNFVSFRIDNQWPPPSSSTTTTSTNK